MPPATRPPRSYAGRGCGRSRLGDRMEPHPCGIGWPGWELSGKCCQQQHSAVFGAYAFEGGGVPSAGAGEPMGVVSRAS
jgi:hypothetical protein